MAENDYTIPTAGDQLFAFNSFRSGGFVCIGLLWLVGFAALVWIGSKSELEPASKLTWPVAVVAILAGIIFSANRSEVRRQRIENRRLIIVSALKSGDIQQLEQFAENGERLHQPLEELGNHQPFQYAIEQQNIEIVLFFMKRPEGERPNLKVWMGSMMATGNREIIDILFDEIGRDSESLG